MGLVDVGFCFGFFEEDFGFGIGLYSGVVSIDVISLGTSGGFESIWG